MWNKDWRGYLLKLRWQAARALAPRKRVLSRGLKFTLQCDNWKTHYRWNTFNTKEAETLDWIDRWMKPADTLFDVGANIGIYSLYAALRQPWGRIIAFEPEYSNLHLLKENVILNGLKEQVEVYALALSDRWGVSHLYVQDLTPGSALHTQSSKPLSTTLSGYPVVWKEGIATTTLDAFCQETGIWPTLVKIDVDGSELGVLEGGKNAIGKQLVRSILIESDDPKTRQACGLWLEEAGFKSIWSDPQGRSGNVLWARDIPEPAHSTCR